MTRQLRLPSTACPFCATPVPDTTICPQCGELEVAIMAAPAAAARILRHLYTTAALNDTTIGVIQQLGIHVLQETLNSDHTP